MIIEKNITTLFLDIGGVLLTNGWTRKSLHLASSRFQLEEEETDERHHLTFDTYEAGKLTLDEYLDRVIFYRERNFTKEEFKTFMFNQSMPVEGALEYFKGLKSLHNLKVIAVNNESRELNDFRIQKYKLDELFDAFVSSCMVHLRKPDVEIFKMACDIAHTSPPNILYVDDRLMFVEVAISLGINGYHFQGIEPAKLFIQKIKFS